MKYCNKPKDKEEQQLGHPKKNPEQEAKHVVGVVC